MRASTILENATHAAQQETTIDWQGSMQVDEYVILKEAL